MILFVVLIVAVLVALLRGGRPSRAPAVSLRWSLLPLLAALPQLVVIFFPTPEQAGLHTALLLLSTLLVLVAVWLNRRVPGVALIGLGLLLNLTVMLANGGYMPITPETVARIGHTDRVVLTEAGARVAGSKDVVLPRDETALWFLGDIFVLAEPYPDPTAFSPGDVLIAVGTFVLIQRAFLGPAPQEKPGGTMQARALPEGRPEGEEPQGIPEAPDGPGPAEETKRSLPCLPKNWTG